MKIRNFASVLAAVSLLLAGCSASDSSREKATQEGYPAELASFYKQKVTWQPCGENECADFAVPLDYEDPEGETISLSMERVAAGGARKMGVLFVNPGGPGGSGKEMARNASLQFSPEVMQAYDVVGIDPRGVGDSSPVECMGDEELGKLLDSDFDLSTEEGKKNEREATEGIAKACEEKSGVLLAHVTTQEAARDLDIAREILGEKKLNYLGYSYGTSLGGMYADLFPSRVGRMVLDGAVDVTLGLAAMGYQQTLGFETNFKHFLESCVADGDCPLGSSVVEGQKKTRELLESALSKPFSTEEADRPLTRTMLTTGIVGMLYDDQYWSYLKAAFRTLVDANDGTLFMKLADLLNGREGDVFNDNSTQANWAINCADYPASSDAEYAQYSKKLEAEAPVFGIFQTGGTDLCSVWPASAKKQPKAYVAEGSAPIVVIGNTYDPATPLEWAKSMKKNLDNAVLLTWEADGHTAYGRAGSCISAPVDEYLLKGTVPKDGLVCPKG